MKHILSVRQFSKPELDFLFNKAESFRETVHSPHKRRLLAERHKGCTIATLFYEPSTRTRLSFEAASQQLGLVVISTENARTSSSVVKGENLEDTIRVVSSYADLIVLRHPEIGAAKRAAAVSSVPIINAGDGGGEHPTQALLDAYTINREMQRIDGLKIGLAGDLLHSRVFHSVIYAMSLYSDIEFYLIAPQQIQLPQSFCQFLKKKGITYHILSSIDSAIADVDVLYMNRIQTERQASSSNLTSFKKAMRLTTALMKQAKTDMIVLDCLPRVHEIAPTVDKDPRAAYFRQAENGLYVRMALIDMLLS